MKKNEDAIKSIFPETWTHIENLDGSRIGFRLKLIGVDWRSEDEFGRVMMFFEKIGILLRDGYLVKRNPHSIFFKK